MIKGSGVAILTEDDELCDVCETPIPKGTKVLCVDSCCGSCVRHVCMSCVLNGAKEMTA